MFVSLLRISLTSLLKKIDCCDGLSTMPSLIDCHCLRTLRVTNNQNLTSLIDASLETCTLLVELILRRNGDLIASNDPLPPTMFSNLKELHVSFFFKNQQMG
jgi:hypothetical protein